MQIIKNCVPRVIGISGHINSGKDLVGIIIRFLTSTPKPFSKDVLIKKLETPQNHSLDFPYSVWEVKKFADKLKDIVCLLIGCTREHLEDREFKEKTLGEEWWYYTDGKNIYPYTSYEGNVKNLSLVLPTPRILLQQIGTDLFRNQLHTNCWINATFANYTTDSNWIITDCRFKNEANAIKDRGGIVIRINRDTLNTSQFRHQSEVDLDDYEFDYTIYNNSDISSLINSVRDMLIYFKIL